MKQPHSVRRLMMIAAIMLALAAGAAVPAFAAGTADGPPATVTPLQNPLHSNSGNFDSVGGIIEGFVEVFSYVAIIIAVLLLVWVGLRFILVRGDSGKITELREWLLWIVIGVAIVIGARIIVRVVISTLGATGVVNQNVIQSAQNAANGN